jgi:cytochrome oxidase Cu insertion factor (SCO1/SenC/PrrC family)
MIGMHHNVSLNNSIVVSLFHHALFEQLLWVIGIAVVILVTLYLFLARKKGDALTTFAEPAARSYLRWLFGAIWIVDGLLQLQAQMPLGLANVVVRPLTVDTPSWLHTLMNSGIGIWNEHPIALAAGAAWIQIGMGLLIFVSRGRVGRFAAATSVGWGLLVWLIGNGAGGIFSPGNSILFGWPGAVLFYVVAGAWLALPLKNFPQPFSRYTLRFFSVVLVLGAVVQTLPGVGFWHGGSTNALKAMSTAMTQTAQPHTLASVVRAGGDLASSLGGGFNLIVIFWLLICAFGMWRAGDLNWFWPTRLFVAGAVLLWFVAEDAPLWGGLATDLNSWLPMAALAFCAAPQRRLRAPFAVQLPVEIRRGGSTIVSSIAAAMVAVAIIPMFWASTVAATETTLYVAQNGSASQVTAPSASFKLTDQYNRPYRLSEHSGYVTVLTFLDPVCWTDCPLLAAQLKSVDKSLPVHSKVDFVAVAADPKFENLGDVRHFIAKEQLSTLKNFYFLTGPLAKLESVWEDYGITVDMSPHIGMSIHSDIIYLLNPQRKIRWIIPDDPLAAQSGGASAESQIEMALATLHR